jgi:hypothetical protein
MIKGKIIFRYTSIFLGIYISTIILIIVLMFSLVFVEHITSINMINIGNGLSKFNIIFIRSFLGHFFIFNSIVVLYKLKKINRMLKIIIAISLFSIGTLIIMRQIGLDIIKNRLEQCYIIGNGRYGLYRELKNYYTNKKALPENLENILSLSSWMTEEHIKCNGTGKPKLYNYIYYTNYTFSETINLNLPLIYCSQKHNKYWFTQFLPNNYAHDRLILLGSGKIIGVNENQFNILINKKTSRDIKYENIFQTQEK